MMGLSLLPLQEIFRKRISVETQTSSASGAEDGDDEVEMLSKLANFLHAAEQGHLLAMSRCQFVIVLGLGD